MFSPDWQFVVYCSDERMLRAWDLAQKNVMEIADSNSTDSENEDDEELVSFPRLRGCDECITCVTFSPDGKYIVFGGNDDGALLWASWRLRKNA